MTYKGVYRDGMVFLHGDVDLQNGARVDVNPSQGAKSGGGGGRSGRGAVAGREAGKEAGKSARRASPGKAPPSPKSAKRVKTSAKLPGFGMWKDRWPASMSSADIARELRERVSRRVP